MHFVQRLVEKAKKGNIIYTVMGLLTVLPCASQDHVKRTKEEIHALHHDSKAYIAMLEDPQRDSYQKPHEVLMALDLKEGEVIADIGAGSGYFSFRLSHHVGETASRRAEILLDASRLLSLV